MFSVFLIGVSLSMDAFAISVANGMGLSAPRGDCRGPLLRAALWMGLYFGCFQFLMPVLGFFLGSGVSRYVEAFGPYISFFLLAFIGGKMLLDGIKGEGEEAMASLSHPRLLLMAVATSIDAFAVGVSFAFMEEFRAQTLAGTLPHLLAACGLIGCTTFVISCGGAVLGSLFPGVSGKKAGILGGAVLIALGVKLLAEGVILK